MPTFATVCRGLRNPCCGRPSLKPLAVAVQWAGPPLEEGAPCAATAEPLWCPLLPLLVEG
jgi:hypothetical protein